jgi:adenylate cyclase
MPTSSGTPTGNPTRELAAIMFSDVVGYTALMGRDEQEALRALDAHRGVLRTLLPRFNGRIVGEVGDGTLCSFHSAIDAVNCAREVQARAEENPELKLRIGIHLGDVVFSNNTILGDGVNVASRIHALAPPGGICISATVYDEIRNKPGTKAKDLGEKKLKNVSRPIRVYLLPSERVVGHPAQRADTWKRRIAAAGGAIALVAIVYGVARWTSTIHGTAERAAPPRQIRSIAVLPLDNFSGDPRQEYFADGMTDELITDLARISALRVISRTSVMQFKGEHRKPVPEIAKELNVDAVVEGSVLKVGDRVRITAQLIDAPNDRHLWAESFERKSRDVLALQDELASAIAREINVQLTPDERARLAKAPSVNPAAHEAYLRGRYFLNSPTAENVEKALDEFSHAIKADPNFAPAYTGVADCYVWGADWYFPGTEVMPKAKAAAEKALQLDDTLAEPHTSLALVKLEYDFDWPGAESEFRRAIELNHGYAFAHDQYGVGLAFHGRLDDSLAEAEHAAQLDPLSPSIEWDMALPLAWQGKYEVAKEHCRKALELDPNFYLAQWALGWVDIQADRLGEAVPELEKAKAMGAPPFVVAYLGYAYAASGERTKAEAVIGELERMPAHRYVSLFCTTIVHLGLGDRSRALEGLEKAYAARSQMLLFLKEDRIFDPLRSDPRFIALLKKTGMDK